MRMWIVLFFVAAIVSSGCEQQPAPKQAPTPPPRFSAKAYSAIRFRLTGHTGVVHTIAFSQNGFALASGGDDPWVKLWDVNSGDLVVEFDGHKDVQTVAFSPKGNFLAVLDNHGAEGIVRLWDLGVKPVHATLPARDVRAIAFHPKEPLLAVSTVASAPNVELWDLAMLSTPVATLDGIGESNDTIRHLAFSPNGEHLAARYEGTELAVWNTSTRKLSLIVAASGEYPFAFSADSSTLALAEEFSTIRFYDVDGGKHQAGGDIQNRGWGRLTSLSCNPDGRFLAAGYGFGKPEVVKVVRLFNMHERQWETTNLIASFEGHEQNVNCVAFSPTDKLLASASDDKTVILWGASP